MKGIAQIILVPWAILIACTVCQSQGPQAAVPEGVPAEGLALWLRADRGVETRGGRVVAWHDLSPSQFVAQTPSPFAPPVFDAKQPAVLFSDGMLLRISERVLPADSRELTILGVARADSAASIGLFSIRNATVPLVQLDVDENGSVRFIVRDRQSRTSIATTPCVFGAKALFGGILSRKDAATGEARVLFGSSEERGSTETFTSPLVDSVAWIGGLVVPGRDPFFWKGAISEVLVYGRALGEKELQLAAEYLTKKHDLKEPTSSFEDTWNVLATRRATGPVAEEFEADICVVGGGSAGVGAAIAAARKGARVVLVERQGRLGGTGANAYVANWEPGPGCSIAKELFERMKAIDGAGVARAYPVHTDAPMGYNLVTEGEPYEKTLRRAGVPGAEIRRLPYKPEAFDRVVREMLAETGNVTVLDGTTFFQAEANDEKTRVESVLAETLDGRIVRVRAKVFIDSTGCAWLCRDLGCEVMLGADPKSRFNEPSAPEKGLLRLNAISRCYLIRPSESPKREPPPEGNVPFPRCAFVTGWKGGLQAVNPMPMLPGRALIDYGYDECLRRSEEMARAHWHWLQRVPEFQGHELAEIAPMLGIRESYRVVTRYVLNENDLTAGLPNQEHHDIIAVADHPCDIHGAGGHLGEVNTAYGIPYRCLVPAGSWQNLLVACRGAGFSKIAASSCRLQRTMIQLGHAAGAAAAMAVEADVPVDRIDVSKLVDDLDARSRYPW
ncbi:MAG: FAD-dependent oxidoreductase [Planctomycetota bacterium]